MVRCLTAFVITMLLAVTPVLGQDGVRFDGHKVVRTWLETQQELRIMLAVSDDPWSHAVGIGPVDWRVAPDAMATLRESGIRFEILIDDIQPRIDAERQRLAGGGAAGPGGWFSDFHDLDGVNARLDELAAAYPDLAEVFTIGQSIEGRDIRGIHISGPGADKPAILFNACQHAREWGAPPVAMYIADRFLTQYDSDPQIQALVDAIDFYIIPVVNPDGYVYTWGPNRLWRKNRRNNGDGTFGVDLNRNWDFGWGGPGSDGFTSSETYRGPFAFSEPESAAMRDFFASHPGIAATIDFHTFSQLVLSPWGYTFDTPPDIDLYNEVGGDMADAILGVHGVPYVAGPASVVLYQASGVSIDWTYGDQGVWSWTFELRDQGGYGFLMPPQEILPTCQENFEAVRVLSEWVLIGVEFTVSPPLYVEADTINIVPLQINPISADDLDVASGRLFVREGSSGPFSESALSWNGDAEFEASLPATACGATLEFYFEIDTVDGSTWASPADAPASLHATTVAAVTMIDMLQSDAGWGIQNINLTDGGWDHGVPAGGGDRQDPPTDFDGSGACFLTDNVDGNSDVDGGPTRLFSPVYDMSSMNDPVISWAQWLGNDDNDADSLDVDVSDDGGSSWSPVTSTTRTPGWVEASFRLADFAGVTDQVQLRFSVTDNPNDSITEGAVDFLRFLELDCGGGVPGDVNGDGIVNVADLLAVLGAWGPCPGCDEDLNGDDVVNVVDLLLVLNNWG